MYSPEAMSGALVKFRIASVMCPDYEEILTQLTRDLEISGRVVLLSDSGNQKSQYAVVEVAGLLVPLVVPVDQLEAAPAELSEAGGQ